MVDEVAEQTLGVAFGITRLDFDARVHRRARADAITWSARFTAPVPPRLRNHLERHPRPGCNLHHREIAEQEFVPCVFGLVRQRPFDFHPLNRVPRYAVFGRQWVDVLLGGAIHPRAEQTGAIGANDLPGAERSGHFADARLGLEIELADPTVLAEAL